MTLKICLSLVTVWLISHCPWPSKGHWVDQLPPKPPTQCGSGEGFLMLRTCRVLCSQAGQSSPGSWQPLSFDGGAFHLKGTGELTRALLVLRLCAWPPLVTHGLAVSSDPGGLT